MPIEWQRTRYTSLESASPNSPLPSTAARNDSSVSAANWTSRGATSRARRMVSRVERPGDAAREREHRVDGPPGDGGHEVACLLASGEDAPAEIGAHLREHADDAPHRRGRGRAGVEVRSAHVPVVEEVILEDEQVVVERLHAPGGGGRDDAVHRVEGACRGDVVRSRADAAHVRGELRHLLGRAPHAEALEPAQLRHLQERALGVPLRVEEHLDLAVPLEPRDRVDRDPARHRSPSSARGNARRHERRRVRVAPERARRIRQRLGERAQLLLAAREERRERRQHRRARIAHAVERAEAAAARHARLDAAGLAPLPRAGPRQTSPCARKQRSGSSAEVAIRRRT